MQDEILLACQGGAAELNAIASLESAKLLVRDRSQRYQVRHKVIAETLIDELSSRGTQMPELVVSLCRALSIRGIAQGGDGRRRSRVLRQLINHSFLLRFMNDIDCARRVFSRLEDVMDSNHHFWLQRGRLELEGGSLKHAANFLEQSRALDHNDPIVENAYAHMVLRRCIENPSAPNAGEDAAGAFDTLRRLIQLRGNVDSYPAHVFGSQALAWTRHAELTPSARRELLREASDLVISAQRTHRGRPELSQLAEDLRREQMRLG